jgi:RimJ/RimL family protein N-acetyltransferase
MILSRVDGARRIRPLRPEDVVELMAWDNDPEIHRLTGKKFAAKGTARAWWDELTRDRARVALAIMDDEGRLIGDVALENVSWRAGEAEIRIAIGDKASWNRGYGTEALAEVARLAFDQLNLKSLYLRVSEDNPRAMRAYEKAGYRKIGRLAASGRLTGRTGLVLMRKDAKPEGHGVSASAWMAGAVSTARS